ncbi:MAG: hypothetical protein ABJG14_18540 [Sulfitobacter sp.]|uniref:hypothetical protein n=1 Tax=Sulfitobacter sp. TaxID=1903071 RepID=UPI00326675AE
MSIFEGPLPVRMSPAQKQRKKARDARIRAARKIRAGWSPSQFIEESQRLEREKAEFLAKLAKRA